MKRNPKQHQKNKIDPTVLHDHKLFNLGTLSAGVVHDLNNLFSGIASFTHLLNEEIQDPKQKKYVAMINQTLSRASELTHNILAFIRDEADTSEEVHPLLCIREVSNMLKHSLGSKIRYLLALPANDEPVAIQRSHLCQILLNLVVNAKDAIGDEGTLSVEGYYNPPNNPKQFVLEVSDTGPGIPEERKNKIFEPFYTTKQESSGSGLGLAIVKTLVNDAEGKIEVTETDEKQTLFRVRLPLAKKKKTSPTSFIHRDPILIWEDDPKWPLTRLLQHQGFPIIPIDGKRALGSTQYYDPPPDMLIVYTKGKGKKEKEQRHALLNRLKKEYPDIKALFCTREEAFCPERIIEMIAEGYN